MPYVVATIRPSRTDAPKQTRCATAVTEAAQARCLRCGPSPGKARRRSLENVVVRESALSHQGNRSLTVASPGPAPGTRNVGSWTTHPAQQIRRAAVARERVPVRIGVIASIAHRLPPTSYGPWEQIA